MTDNEDEPFWIEMEAHLAKDPILAGLVDKRMLPHRSLLPEKTFRHFRAVLVQMLTEHAVMRETVNRLRPRFVLKSGEDEIPQFESADAAKNKKKPASGESR